MRSVLKPVVLVGAVWLGCAAYIAAHTGGVTICAIYPAAPGQAASECQAMLKGQ